LRVNFPKGFFASGVAACPQANFKKNLPLAFDWGPISKTMERSEVGPSALGVSLGINLNSGNSSPTISTSDLITSNVQKNSAYSS
jgi:N-acetylglutamate synthase/N-acetylornithine aminotransferase